MKLSAISLAITRIGRAGAAVFSPLSLFASSEVGAWYDPSDLSTMFQDAAGTTPVTADGQPVGLILDKSKGLALGSELIVDAANRDFSSDTGFWSKEGSATISGGVVNINNPTGTAAIYKFNFPNEAEGYYEIAFDLVLTAGSVEVLCGVGLSNPITTSGRKLVRLYRPTVSTFAIRTVGATTAIGTIDNLTIKRVEGNHASQATAAARPLFKTDGTYHWLQFDGIDDYIGGAWTTPTSLSTVFYGTNRIDNESWVMFMRGVSAGQGYAGVCQAGGTSEPQSSSGTPSYTVNQSIVTPTQRGALDTAIGFNALKVVTIENIDFNDATFPWNAFEFGFYSGFAPQFRAYSVIALGRQATSQEITDTETWVNSKTGAY